jgi:hypothetical protein
VASGCSRSSRLAGAAMGGKVPEGGRGTTVSTLIMASDSRMFVRGLQSSYNHYTPRLGIKVPHGELLVFGACCGQIMFAWLLSPETMPKEYSNWSVRCSTCRQVADRNRILSASRVPDFAVVANRSIIRQKTLDPYQVQRALSRQVRSTLPFATGSD